MPKAKKTFISLNEFEYAYLGIVTRVFNNNYKLWIAKRATLIDL